MMPPEMVCGDLGRQERTDEVEHRGQEHGGLGLEGAGGDGRRHRVRGVVEAVREVEEQRQRYHQNDDAGLRFPPFAFGRESGERVPTRSARRTNSSPRIQVPVTGPGESSHIVAIRITRYGPGDAASASGGRDRSRPAARSIRPLLPGRRAIPSAHSPRRRRRRPVRVVAREGRSGGHRASRRGERLHEGAHRAPRGLRELIFEEIKDRTNETDLSVPTPARATGGTTPARSRGSSTASTAARRSPRPTTGRRRCSRPTPTCPASRCCSTTTSRPRATSSTRSGSFDVTADGRLMLYGVDVEGDERYTVRVRDLTTGEQLPDVIEGTAGGGVFDPTAATSSMRPSTSRGGPTRSGGTRSARRSPTT